MGHTMNYEYEYDDHTLFIGEIEEVDESFDHAFGVEKRTGYELKDFSIVVYISNMDHDVTSAIENNDPKLFELYKERFIEHYIEQLGE